MTPAPREDHTELVLLRFLPQLSIMISLQVSANLPGRQRDMQARQVQMQDCVDKILAKVDPAAAAG